MDLIMTFSYIQIHAFSSDPLIIVNRNDQKKTNKATPMVKFYKTDWLTARMEWNTGIQSQLILSCLYPLIGHQLLTTV